MDLAAVVTGEGVSANILNEVADERVDLRRGVDGSLRPDSSRRSSRIPECVCDSIGLGGTITNI